MIFAINGPGVKVGAGMTGGTLLDLAPTMAWLLGIPVAEDLPGCVLQQAFEPAHLGAHPVWTTPS